ncbi:MAG: hypothetical protein GMKNLPBB_00948 [Myxococcota bacterium]|nr:hypothetical protein [Myxococcota bacterium]
MASVICPIQSPIFIFTGQLKIGAFSHGVWKCYTWVMEPPHIQSASRAAPGHTLLIRCGRLGDVVLATPLLQALRAWFPDGRLTLMTSRALLPLFATAPGIESIAWEDRAAWRPSGQPLAVVDLQGKLSTRLFARRLKPGIHGVFRKRGALDALRELTGFPRVFRHVWQADWYFDALPPDWAPESAGARADRFPLAVWESRDAAAAALRFMKAHALPPGGFVALHPHASRSSKAWPLEHAAELFHALDRQGVPAVLLHGPGEEAMAEELRRLSGLSLLPAAGGMDTGELAALIRCAKRVISADSGPLHLAAACGVPTVGLFGPTPVERWAPRGPDHHVLHLDLPCQPCSNLGGAGCPLDHHRCMRELTPERVLKALDSFA